MLEPHQGNDFFALPDLKNVRLNAAIQCDTRLLARLCGGSGTRYERTHAPTRIFVQGAVMMKSQSSQLPISTELRQQKRRCNERWMRTKRMTFAGHELFVDDRALTLPSGLADVSVRVSLKTYDNSRVGVLYVTKLRLKPGVHSSLRVRGSHD